MLKIKTKWKRNGTGDEQETEQTFLDVPHYREYQKVMLGRGYLSFTISVYDVNAGKFATVENEKITFGGN